MSSSYCALSVLQWHFKSKRLATNYMMEAIRHHKANKVFRGKTYLRFNTWINTWEFLLVEQRSETAASKIYEIEQVAKRPRDAAEPTGARALAIRLTETHSRPQKP